MLVSRAVAGFAGDGKEVRSFPGQEKAPGIVEASGVAGQAAFVDWIVSHFGAGDQVQTGQISGVIR